MTRLIIAAARVFDGRDVHPAPATLPPTTRPGAPEGADSTGGECGMAVLVEGGRVAAVGGLAELTSDGNRGVRVDRYPGATVSPGLIDAHVHLTMPGDGTAYEPAAGAPAATRFALAVANLRAHLAAGVTTVRDLGSHLDLLAWTPDEAHALPRLLRAGPPVTTAGGHMRMFGGEVADAAGAARRATPRSRSSAWPPASPPRASASATRSAPSPRACARTSPCSTATPHATSPVRRPYARSTATASASARVSGSWP
jgi:imidazolonepropionase-like amidohydrolase